MSANFYLWLILYEKDTRFSHLEFYFIAEIKTNYIWLEKRKSNSHHNVI